MVKVKATERRSDHSEGTATAPSSRSGPAGRQGRPGRKANVPDPVTLAGLVFETAAGLRHEVGPPLERDYELPGQSFEVLVRLARSPGNRLRMSDLSAQSSLTPSGLTRAVDRLVEAGLVQRAACPSDRRGAFATLTALGEKRMTEALGCHSSQLRRIFDDVFDEEEWATLDRLLRRLRDRVNPGATRMTP